MADGMMMTALHLTRGDTLWFAACTGALAATCIGLFLLALAHCMSRDPRGAMGPACPPCHLQAQGAPPRATVVPAHDIARGARRAARVTGRVRVRIRAGCDDAYRPSTRIEDPRWQVRFTIMWSSLLGICIVLAAPRVVRGLRSGTSLAGFAGVRVAASYAPIPTDDGAFNLKRTALEDDVKEDVGPGASSHPSWVHTAASLLSSLALWSVPAINLNLGQLFVIAAYNIFTLITTILNAPLLSNPNRPGLIALAQLPPLFLFAMKNSPVALLLGPGVDYTKLNYVHRWAGRGLFLGAFLHGAIWVENHLTWNRPILSRDKGASGVAAFVCLVVIVLSSVSPLRRWSYKMFLVVHYITFPAFLIAISCHTPFVTPWIIPSLVLYALDVLVRLLKLRIVAGRVRAYPGGMSIISVPAATTGWRAGQHIRLRALVGGRTFAHAHPLTALCAPLDTTCLAPPPGLLLAARACGPWSRALHAFGQDFSENFEGAKGGSEGRAVYLVLDGPYGGPTLDPGAYDDVLFLAGGSGVTATLGLLDDLVGRCVRRARARGERTRRVEWVWCVKHADVLDWFAPHLEQIAAVAASPGSGLTLHIRVFITGPEAVSDVLGCKVRPGRPSARALLDELMVGASESMLSQDKDPEHGVLAAGTGFAVLAAGPVGLIREAGNAVARANISMRAAVDFSAEVYAI
ncbi:ferric reductase like transmembrane component-domain-containing protein [Mycena rosella]|uniref:Ferric reductase like transmembrane component-domain-containing protein n=1 Tax=Mycena rosella TaxID=1033263 RepID=A0AAD7DZ35_MYCRO|nr:ferric reductase like transmembrane component-domain-containing protein [Mycena rosella]